LEFAVRCGVGGWEDDDEGDGDSGFGEDGTTLQEYKACVEDAMEAIRDDGVVTSD
jgi:hypothetical protein